MSVSLAGLGWSDQLAAAFTPYSDTHHPARVCRVDRGAVDVLTAVPGIDRARVRHVAAAVGDWVALAVDTTGPYVDQVLPRTSAVQRAAASGRSQEQVIAANVDVVLVTVPVFPEPNPGLVERLVALVWDSGATPVVAVTKADLSDEATAVVADVADLVPGVDTVAVSAVADGGLDPLQPYLTAGTTLCLLGRSGAGKSSLVNALIGADRFAISDVRADGKGRHTTTHRELVALPSGALLIDTPGLRGAGVWVSDDGVDRTFADVASLITECRFGDCAHETEPGCAVLDAVDAGALPLRRLESWRKLQREAAWMASRHDARLQAERRRSWKILTAEVRRSGRIRP